jgi:hypothetical protein
MAVDWEVDGSYTCGHRTAICAVPASMAEAILLPLMFAEEGSQE